MTAASEPDDSASIIAHPVNSLPGQRLAWLAMIVFIVINLSLMALRLVNKPFNPDELQHAHIAWTIAQGEILYKDFWDHHGPFYNLMNGALIFLTDPAPSLRLLFISRVVSFAAMLAVLGLTWRIARELRLSRLTSLLAVAVFSSLYFLQNKGVEARPDVLQSLFWIAGFCLLLRNQRQSSLLRAFLGGVLFTLAILSNSKAGIGPFFVVVYYLSAPFLFGMAARDWWRDMTGMALGLVVTMAPFLTYFYVTDSLDDFFYYNFLFALQLTYYWSVGDQSAYAIRDAGLAVEYAVFFLRYQFPFVLATLAGIVLWLPRLRDCESGQRRGAALFLIAALGASAGWVTNLFSQFFLVFLPLLSVFAAVGVVAAAGWLQRQFDCAGRVAVATAAAAAAAVMLWYPLANATFTQTRLLAEQIAFTEKIVGRLDRDEPVGVVWSTCGGYVFNRNVGFYWVAMPGVSNLIEVIAGEHPFGDAFIRQLEQQQVQYVIGRQDWMTEGLTAAALDYLNNNFSYTHCLWTRRP